MQPASSAHANIDALNEILSANKSITAADAWKEAAGGEQPAFVKELEKSKKEQETKANAAKAQAEAKAAEEKAAKDKKDAEKAKKAAEEDKAKVKEDKAKADQAKKSAEEAAKKIRPPTELEAKMDAEKGARKAAADLKGI